MNASVESGKSALPERVKAIILKPKEEWLKIAAEDTPTRQILTGYIIPLALIAPIASFIGGQIFGYGAFGFSYRPGILSALIMAVVAFVLALINFLILTLVADFLSPKFGGETSNYKAFKLVAYASTAAWLAGVFSLVPALGFFGLLGLYSIYQFYTGTGPMLNVPKDKAVSFAAVVFVCAIVLNLLVAALSTANMALLRGMGLIEPQSVSSGTITLPGGKSINMGAIQKMSQQAQDAANGKVKPVDPAMLQALLPASLGVYARTSTESTAAGPMGSNAEGTYTSGNNSFTLSITDMSAAGAIAGIGAAMGVSHNQEDADSYDRTSSVNGQMQTESWNKKTNTGKFGKVVDNRFMVEADGTVQSIDQLKNAVNAIKPDDLKGLEN